MTFVTGTPDDQVISAGERVTITLDWVMPK